MATFYVIVTALTLLFAYLWLANDSMSKKYPEALKHAQDPWTEEEMQKEYQKALRLPVDVRPFLPPKQNRRYIVVGGSGLVGGWIVQQLLLRGESPSAIRILDLRPPTRPEVHEHNIAFLQTDVTSPNSVVAAFTASWPSADVSALPITVIHCVAFIGASDRHPLTSDVYMRVNFEGTRNVLAAAQSLATTNPSTSTIFIATSSGSIALSPPTYLPLVPSFSAPQGFIQSHPNAKPPHTPSSPVTAFGSCYAYSKYHAERLVLSAHSPSTNFLTGCIRPAHAIYGHGVENTNSLSYDYLRRHGAMTWLKRVVVHFVDARNVSLGHLCYEEKLLAAQEKVGGKAYAITDPNPAVTYNHLYTLLTQLAHQATPVAFPTVAPLPMLLLAYAVEAYSLLRLRLTKPHHLAPQPTSSSPPPITAAQAGNPASPPAAKNPQLPVPQSLLSKLASSLLPPLTGDISTLQPAIFNMSTAHFLYDDELAQRELGYRGCVGTLRGLVDAVVDWNQGVERKIREGKTVV